MRILKWVVTHYKVCEWGKSITPQGSIKATYPELIPQLECFKTPWYPSLSNHLNPLLTFPISGTPPFRLPLSLYNLHASRKCSGANGPSSPRNSCTSRAPSTISPTNTFANPAMTMAMFCGIDCDRIWFDNYRVNTVPAKTPLDGSVLCGDYLFDSSFIQVCSSKYLVSLHLFGCKRLQ